MYFNFASSGGALKVRKAEDSLRGDAVEPDVGVGENMIFGCITVCPCGLFTEDFVVFASRKMKLTVGVIAVDAVRC